MLSKKRSMLQMPRTMFVVLCISKTSIKIHISTVFLKPHPAQENQTKTKSKKTIKQRNNKFSFLGSTLGRILLTTLPWDEN